MRIHLFIIAIVFITNSINVFSQDKIDFLKSITSVEDFQALESTPLSNKFNNVTSVKVIYHIEDSTIYFSNSDKYHFHNDFCREQLGYWGSVSHFNLYNYSKNNNRQYLLANINHYRDIDLYTFEFSPYEIISEDNILFHQAMQSLFIVKEDLPLFLGSNNHIQDLQAIDSSYQFIEADVIYNDLQYQALNLTKSYGYLKKVSIEEIEDTYISPYDILLVDGTPNDLPLCQGIITIDFQAPLSHINILSHNRGTPIMALKTAWENDDLANLDGSIVYFEVKTDTFLLEKARRKDAEKFWQKNRPQHKTKLAADFDQEELINIEDLDRDDIKAVGAKAANFGELDKIDDRIKVPEAAFAIPFYYYQEHVTQPAIDTLLQRLFTDEKLQDDAESLQDLLSKIRKQIKKAPINDTLLELISQEVLSNGICWERMRFRSSTNAEDIAGFNGAGLYGSETGYLYNKDKSVEKAVKKVWASLWNWRAYQERSYFQISHEDVAMGILAHRSFPNEILNGVAITKNIYREEVEGNIINIQEGEVSVVNPPFGTISEQFVLRLRRSTDPKTVIADYIAYSSLTDGVPLLSNEELVELNTTLRLIKTHFYRKLKANWKMDYTSFGLDVEFKYDGENRQLYIKQVRPY